MERRTHTNNNTNQFLRNVNQRKQCRLEQYSFVSIHRHSRIYYANLPKTIDKGGDSCTLKETVENETILITKYKKKTP